MTINEKIAEELMRSVWTDSRLDADQYVIHESRVNAIVKQLKDTSYHNDYMEQLKQLKGTIAKTLPILQHAYYCGEDKLFEKIFSHLMTITTEEKMTEEHRLRIKCNQYAKRLVSLGEDDVVWEVEPKIKNTSSDISNIQQVLKKLAENQTSLTSEMIEVINENFWELF